MKIGIVTTWFERGAAYVSRQYMQCLEDEGHEVYIFARGGESYGKGNSKWDSPRVTWSRRYSFPIATYVEENEFRVWVSENKLDVVFFNEQIWFKPVQICRDMGVKTGLYIDYYTERLMSAFEIFDFLICNTKKHLAAFDWHPQAIYIPWGTDVDLFDCADARLPSNKLRFFHSGGMSPHRKGTDLLIKAYEICLKDDIFREGSELIIHTQVGLPQAFLGRRNGNEIIKSLNNIAEHGSLVIVEKTVPAPGLYHMGDIYVYPSRLEGIGLTVAEAISCGMPVIVPDDGPMNEFLPGNGSYVVKVKRFTARADGYYWPQNEIDIEDLAEKMLDSYYKKNTLNENSAVSRTYALSSLDWADRKNAIAEAFCKTKILDVSSATCNFALSMHSSRFPLIHKYETVYRLALGFYLWASKLNRKSVNSL